MTYELVDRCIILLSLFRKKNQVQSWPSFPACGGPLESSCEKGGDCWHFASSNSAPCQVRDRSLQDYAARILHKSKDDCGWLLKNRWFWWYLRHLLQSLPYQMYYCDELESWSLPHLTPCQSRLLQHLVPQTLGFLVGEDSDGDETKGPHPPNATLTPNPCLRSHCSHCKFPVWEEAADLFFDDLWRPRQKPLKKSSNHRSNEGGWVAGIIPGLTSPGYTSTSPTTAVSLGIRFGDFGVTACYSVAVLVCSCARFLEFEILLRI